MTEYYAPKARAEVEAVEATVWGLIKDRFADNTEAIFSGITNISSRWLIIGGEFALVEPSILTRGQKSILFKLI